MFIVEATLEVRTFSFLMPSTDAAAEQSVCMVLYTKNVTQDRFLLQGAHTLSTYLYQLSCTHVYKTYPYLTTAELVKQTNVLREYVWCIIFRETRDQQTLT